AAAPNTRSRQQRGNMCDGQQPKDPAGNLKVDIVAVASRRRARGFREKNIARAEPNPLDELA
ncbi:hypothetical protein Dimus_036302, partial [Dionaea muscipula]